MSTIEDVTMSDKKESIELNGTENVIAEFFAKARKNKRRSSFFGFPATEEPVDEKELEEAYMKKLEKENEDWVAMLKDFNDKRVSYWREERNATVDKSLLSKERQDFLAKAIDMKQYLKESEEFNKRVDLYADQKRWLGIRYNDLIEKTKERIKEKIYEEEL